MRRLLILFLLACLPLQASWAALATYCQHEERASGGHLGHHEHAHRGHGTPDADMAPAGSEDAAIGRAAHMPAGATADEAAVVATADDTAPMPVDATAGDSAVTATVTADGTCTPGGAAADRATGTAAGGTPDTPAAAAQTADSAAHDAPDAPDSTAEPIAKKASGTLDLDCSHCGGPCSALLRGADGAAERTATAAPRAAAEAASGARALARPDRPQWPPLA